MKGGFYWAAYNIKRDEYYLTFRSTDKANPYVAAEHEGSLQLKVADVVPDEITGITKVPMDEDSRAVEYRTKIVPNELGSFFPDTISNARPETRVAYFKKFDDGWRLVR